jgi:serine/threonine-protein kinase
MPLILDGRYLPLKRLGGGAFGTTFLGTDLRSAKQRQCVIKQLQLRSHLSCSQIEGVKRAFRREAEILEVLGDNHRQIPTLYAYFGLTAPAFMGSGRSDSRPSETEEYIYLVQEYVRGQDLDKELRRRGKFTEAEVMEIAQQTLPVLQFVHEQGAIHRDIKPSNLMRDQNGRIYLIDFGAVKQVTTGVPLHSNSLVFGTLGFAPPEQIAGKQVYPSTDLYSFAVTMLCLLTGQSPEALLDLSGDTWSWHSFTQISDRLEQTLNKMLKFVPGQRFQSANAVMTALWGTPPPSVPTHLQTHPTAADAAASGLEDATAVLPESWANHASQSQIETYLPAVEVSPAQPPLLDPAISPPSASVPPTNLQQPTLTPVFVARCQQELAYFIGPIAGLVVEEALTQYSPATLQQLVEILMQEIPDSQAALEFRRKLLS